MPHLTNEDIFLDEVKSLEKGDSIEVDNRSGLDAEFIERNLKTQAKMLGCILFVKDLTQYSVLYSFK